MLKWLDSFMEKFAHKDHIRREEHARKVEAASPVHEEAAAMLEAFPHEGAPRARAIAAALSGIAPAEIENPEYAVKLLRAAVRGFSGIEADVRTTLAPAQVMLNLMPALKRSALAGGFKNVPFNLAEGVVAMRTGQFEIAFEKLGDANRERAAGVTEDWSSLLPMGMDGDMLPAAARHAPCGREPCCGDARSA